MQAVTEIRKLVVTKGRELIKAVAVIPGQANTIHLREVPKPAVADVANGRGVLVKMLRVGGDGTDGVHR